MAAHACGMPLGAGPSGLPQSGQLIPHGFGGEGGGRGKGGGDGLGGGGDGVGGGGDGERNRA